MTAKVAEPTIQQTENGQVVTLILSNQKRRNAITRSMWEALTHAARALSDRNDIRVVIIRGEGRDAFASGADISEFGEHRRHADQAEEYRTTVQDALDAIEAIPVPVIAHVNGFCIGAGTAVALACDMRFLGEAAQFGIPAAKLGIGYSPDWIRSLAEVVGKATAAEILMSGKLFNSQKALRCGFANEVLKEEDLDPFVENLAQAIAQNAPLSLQAAKICLRELFKFDRDRDWTSTFVAADICSSSRDYEIALEAFASKRTPVFIGE